jgi:hypothetical protein
MMVSAGEFPTDGSREASPPQRDSNPDQLIRPRPAEPIKASGHARPHRKAGHMTEATSAPHENNSCKSGAIKLGAIHTWGGLLADDF